MADLKDTQINWIGHIPSHWSLKKIKYVFWERKENNDPIQTENLISLTIEKGVIPHSEKTGGGNKPKEDLTKYKIVRPGDIVLNSMNVIAGAVGISKFFGILSPVYYMLIPKDQASSKEYFHHLFRTELFQKSLYGLGNGILIKESEETGKLNTIRMRIPMDKLGDQFIPVPPTCEQELISRYLDKKTSQIDSLINKIEKKIQLLKEQRISSINQYVTKGIHLNVEMKDSGVKWIGQIPKHWDVKRVSTLYSQSSIRGFENEENLSVFRDFGVVRRVDHENKNVLSEDLSTYKLVNKGDLVLNKMKTWMGSLGVSEYRGIVSPAYYVLTPNFEFFSGYLHHLLRSKVYIDQYASVSKGVRPGQWDLSIDSFKALNIILPPLEEQKEIHKALTTKLSENTRMIDLEEARIQKLNEYRQSVVSLIVTGKIKINEEML